MTVIGEIIKKAIDVSGLITGLPDPGKSQMVVLRELVSKARLTAFGKKYQFSSLLESQNLIKSFQNTVPIHDYDKMFQEWWHYLLQGHQNVTWPGGQRFFALSSGTTSKSKSIPVTDEMLEAIRKSAIQQIISMKNFDLPGEFFEKQIMMLSSNTDLIQKDDHEEGEISGISASQIPFWFKGFYKPGDEISAIKDWDEKIKRIAAEAPQWDISGLSGIPSWVEMMLKAVIEHHRLDNIHQIWPNLMVYTSGGVALEPYRKSLEKLFGRPMIFVDTYLTSEGYIATQKRPDTDAMSLILDNGIFFEFVPFTENNMDENGRVRQEAKVLSYEETELAQDYVLLISTVAGAWRYMIGDTIMITDKKLAEIRITGRTKHFLNVVGEQLSVHQMNNAMSELAADFQAEISEFVVSAVQKNGSYINKWYLGTNKPLPEAEVTTLLDSKLREKNKNYDVARGKSLKGVEVRVINVQKFYDWSECFKKLGGQAKIPRVMKEEEFLQFEKFVSPKT